MKRMELAQANEEKTVFGLSVMSQKKLALKFAVCISNEDYEAALELHKIYRVLPGEDAATDGDIRVIDESGEDYLYPADWFAFIELPRSVERSLLRAA
jgi:hypothetical protein